MSFKGGLFTEKEIQGMASPERLDTMFVVTSKKGWIALVVVCVLILELLVWSIFGKLPITVEGKGILLKDRVVDIEAGADGRVLEINVLPGAEVKVGDVVAILEPSGIGTELRMKQARLKDLEIEDVRASPLEETERLAKISALESEQKSIPRQISIGEELLAARRAEYAKAQTNLDRGFITQAQLNAALEARSSAETNLEQLKNRQNQIPGELASIRASTSEKTESRRLEIADLKRETVKLSVQLEGSSKIESHVSGVVLEHMVDRANIVTAKTRVMTIEPNDSTMEAVIYVAAEEAKKIPVTTAGVPPSKIASRVNPSTVKPEEFGFILGEVRSVASFPATPEGMQRVLRNQTFIEELTEEGAPIEVRATLYRTKDTPSGFLWSSSEGPAVGIASGTLCDGKFEVARKSPISYVIPFVKKTIGIQ